MIERQKRLIEVYEHLRRYFGIHTKTGFAEETQEETIKKNVVAIAAATFPKTIITKKTNKVMNPTVS